MFEIYRRFMGHNKADIVITLSKIPKSERKGFVEMGLRLTQSISTLNRAYILGFFREVQEDNRSLFIDKCLELFKGKDESSRIQIVEKLLEWIEYTKSSNSELSVNALLENDSILIL